MSFPRYPKYKPSGVEWLGDVPEHWEVRRLKFLCNIQTGDKDTENAIEDGEYPFFVRSQTVERINSYTSDCEAVLTAGDGVGVGKVFHYYTGKFDFHQRVYMMNEFRDALGRFLFHFLRENFYKVALEGGAKSTVDSLRRPLFTNFTVALPSVSEQMSIIQFVEAEAQKIDELVAEQRRLIELLKEKRQAIISHAVTKGLNPHAPTKSSGIEWLGDVPEHWEVAPLKRLVEVPITDGPHETPEFRDEGVPFVSAEAVSSGSIDFSKVRAYISEEDNARYSMKYSPKLHDIYMVKSGATTGITAIVEDRTDFNIWSPLAAIRCGSSSAPYFVLNFMRSKNFLEAVTLNWSFGTQQNIGMGVIENLVCTAPPLQEQIEIADYLKSQTTKLDTLTAEAQRGIELLQERRTALISAAVTGKIDVRNFVSQIPEVA
jgi:type I restriction enzyme S subunit